MEIFSYCVADRINLSAIVIDQGQWPDFAVEKFRDVVEIYNTKKKQYCYIFANGTLVSWNIKRYRVKHYLDLARSAAINVNDHIASDACFFTLGQTMTVQPHSYFNLDCLTIEEFDNEILLSLAFGFSQSIKLKAYEDRLEMLIKQYHPYVLQLNTLGKIKLSRRNIKRMIGRILLTKTELNLVGGFLYFPKFFWQHPNLEDHFAMLERYLDITKRANILNQKLNTLNEMFELFNGYLEDKHSHNLEIIIILLIAIEIIFSLLNLHL